MNTEKLLEYAKVNSQGSILAGKNTVIDGAESGREIGIFTHIHADHTEQYSLAKHQCSAIFVSPPTFDLLAALEQLDVHDELSSEAYFNGRHIHRVDFGETFIPKRNLRQINPKKELSDQITLHKAHHILGSAQVSVDTDDGVSILYSSDFSYPTKPPKCDILVLDATHGDPMFNANVESCSLEDRLAEAVEEEIQAGKPVVVKSHVGRLQYVIHLLSEKLPHNIEFLSSKKNIRLSNVYKKWQMGSRELKESGTYDADTISEGNFPFVEFLTGNLTTEAEIMGRAAVFEIGGHHLGDKTTIRKYSENLYRLEFGDHGNYQNILKYVKDSEAKLVITDNYRSSWGVKLAERIKEEFPDIEVFPQPVTKKDET